MQQAKVKPLDKKTYLAICACGKPYGKQVNDGGITAFELLIPEDPNCKCPIGQIRFNHYEPVDKRNFTQKVVA
jgi:hypothetical protein